MQDEETLVHTDSLGSNKVSAFAIKGIKLIFYNHILNQYKEIEFVNKSRRGVIRDLDFNLQYDIDPSASILEISYSDVDPGICTAVTNTMAEFFIKQLLEFNRFHTSSVLQSLSEQLDIARKELDKSETALQWYRETNPYVALRGKGEKVVNSLASGETRIMQLEENEKKINDWLTRKQQTSDVEEEYYIYQEILAFLSRQDMPGIMIFNKQYSDLIAERQKLLAQNYYPSHPSVLKVEEKIPVIKGEIDKRIEQYISQNSGHVQQLQNELVESEQDLKKLPKNQLKLAELERDHRIKEQLVANLMAGYNEAIVSDASILPDAYIIDEAEEPWGAKAKIQFPTIASGFMIGLVVSVAIFFLIGLFDQTIKNAQEIQEYLQLPVLVSVPVIDSKKAMNGNGHLDSSLVTQDYTPTIENESFRRLRIKLSPRKKDDHNTIIITSLLPNEGKSFVSSNLAITFAQVKRLTLLIDCDLRKGEQHQPFGCKNEPGLTDFLMSNCAINAENISKIIQKTPIPYLFMISTGQIVPNPSELLGTQRMEELYHYLKRNFSIIVIDTPPFKLVPDIFVFKNYLRKSILVTRFDKTNMSDLKNNLHEFPANNMEIEGVVFNAAVEEYKKYKKYEYSYYNYKY